MTHIDPFVALEPRLFARCRTALPDPVATLLVFALKQAWACLFGASLLAALILTRLVWQADWPVARYDTLVLVALTLQALFLALRLESWSEARVIALFHLTGTAMEIFKVHAGSWSYPEPGLLKVMGVPLFSGFMYAAVGSYMVRVIRVFEMRFTIFPNLSLHFGLAALIYFNFFAHHFGPDLRVGLFFATAALYARTAIRFRVGDRWFWMPLPVAAVLASVFLWLAENIGTLTNTWLYAGQSPGDVVSFAKMGSWYLLLYVAFATVTIVVRAPLQRPRPSLATKRTRSGRPPRSGRRQTTSPR